MNPTAPDASPAGALAGGLPQLPGVSVADWAAALQALIGRSGAALCVKEIAAGRVVFADERFEALFDAGAGIVGATESSLIGDAQGDAVRAAEQAAIAGVAPIPEALRIGADAQRRDFMVSRVALPGPGEAARYVASLWVETTEEQHRGEQLKRALEQIEREQKASGTALGAVLEAALRDSVTGLYQRAQFDDLLRREVDLSLREHREFALAAVEIDPLDDSARALGAAAGQRVQEALGRLLLGNTRAMDASCRIDARRFAVLLSGVGLATAHSRMESMRRQCATQIVVHDGIQFGFTVSMGVASFPHTAHTQDDLLRAADAALAEARRRGGNHVTLASIRFEAH